MKLEHTYLVSSKKEHTYLETILSDSILPDSQRFETRVFLCLSHAPDLGFSMGQITNERNSQSDNKGDLASLFITVQP